MRVPALGPEDSLEDGMATHSSILAWRIPWTKEPGGLQSMGLQRVRHDQSNLKHTDSYSFLEVKVVSGNHVDFFSEERGQAQNKQVLQVRDTVCECQKAFPTWHPREGLG